MKYFKYFGLMTKELGRLNLAAMQFQRLMNRVHLEGMLFDLHKTKEANEELKLIELKDNQILNFSAKGL